MCLRVCERVCIQGIKNGLAYQATEDRLGSLLVTNRMTIFILIVKYSSLVYSV